MTAKTSAAITTGLRESASAPGGTSTDVFGGLDVPVYRQVGTAQSIAAGTETMDAWGATVVPASATHEPIVVVVSIQNGGSGDVAAALVARQILSTWFTGKPGRYIAGSSTAQ